MSDHRKNFLTRRVSGWFWSPFFDSSIQKIMDARKKPGDWAFCDTVDKRLAWPIAVYECVTFFVFSPEGDKRDHAEDFVKCFELDPEFTSALLLGLTIYSDNPRPMSRRVHELDEPYSSYGRPTTWQDVAFQISGRDSKTFANKVARIGANEIKKVKATFLGWKEHFKAADKLTVRPSHLMQINTISVYSLTICPRPKIRQSFLSPKIKNK